MSKSYINARFNKQTKTVDEFDTFAEARIMIKHYQLSDIGHTYWVSNRPTREWSIESRLAVLEAKEITRQIEKNFEALENGPGSNVSYDNGPYGEQ